MVTENVDIRFRESGARVVKRRIDQIGVAANNATRGIFLMQRALFVVGGAGALRALVNQVDLLTNYENRLKLTTTSAQNLADVQNELFDVARKSRSSFEAVADVYTRTALSVKALGISQRETLRFTESLSKAAIISGASAREANAAMIQLGQGMASNRLSGDEMRSVLEQLPFVADVIAKHLGITRGELRQFGKDGKVTAITVLRAFRAMSSEIDVLFANTSPTIAQAFTVAHTNILQFIDTLDDSTNASAGIASAIIKISENIDLLVISLAALAVSFSVSFAGRQIASVNKWVVGIRAGAEASARMTEVERIRSTNAVRRIKDTIKLNNVEKITTATTIRQLTARRADIALQKQQQAITVAGFRTRSVLTGQFVNRTAAQAALTRTTIALIRTDRLLKAENAQLAVSTQAVTAAQAGQTAASARLLAAQGASVTISARLARNFPLLAGAANLARGAVSSLWSVMAANPITATIAAVAAVGFAFFRWGNEIKVTEDGIVGLRDATVAAMGIMLDETEAATVGMVETMAAGITLMTEKWTILTDFITIDWGVIGSTIHSVLTFLVRLTIGVIAGLKASWGLLGDAIKDVAEDIVNAFKNAWLNVEIFSKKAINVLIEGLNSVKGGEPIELFTVPESPKEVVKKFETAAGAAAGAYTEAFSKAVTANKDPLGDVSNFFADQLKVVTDRARAQIEARNKASTITEDTTETDTAKKAKKGPTFAKEIAEIQRKIDVLKLNNAEQAIANGLARIAKKLKRELTEGEIKLADAKLRELEASKMQFEMLNAILGPREENILQQAALNQLYEDGRIGLEDYEVAMRKLQDTANSVSGTFAGGFRSAFNGMTKSAQDLGKIFGDTLKKGIEGAADALVEFAQTGKFSIRALFTELITQLLKSMAIQLLMKALGLIIPGAGAGAGAGGGGGIAGIVLDKVKIPGLATGGSIMPSGSGTTDSEIVSFKKRPDERVDVLTPDQQRARDGGGGGSAPVVVPAPEVKIANVLDPAILGQFIQTDEGERLIVNVIRRSGVLGDG